MLRSQCLFAIIHSYFRSLLPRSKSWRCPTFLAFLWARWCRLVLVVFLVPHFVHFLVFPRFIREVKICQFPSLFGPFFLKNTIIITNISPKRRTSFCPTLVIGIRCLRPFRSVPRSLDPLGLNIRYYIGSFESLLISSNLPSSLTL